MSRTRIALAAALSLLPLGQPLLLGSLTGITTATTAVLLQGAPAIAQDASAVARIATAITVRIEGATQGSGVLVKKEGNRYTVLTAWHVVSGNQPGEELAIFTPDGKEYQLEQGSIERLGEVDMAVLTFSSPGAYEVAEVGDIKSVSSGNPIFVSGYPLPTSAVPSSIWRFLEGKVIANATVAIPDGYQLLYSNPTLPGMSGGSVLNRQGKLVGIHGRSEKDDHVSIREGKNISTGTNQAVPITYYKQFDTGQTVAASRTQATSADDYLAQSNAAGASGNYQETIRLANKALALKPSYLGYVYRAYAKYRLKDYQGAIADYSKAIAINPQYADAYNNRGLVKRNLKNYQGAIADFNKAIAIFPQYVNAYTNRGLAKRELGDYQGAIADSTKAIEIDPQDALAYNNRGLAKNKLGDYQGAIADHSKAIEVDPRLFDPFVLRGIARKKIGDLKGACADWRKAYGLGYASAAAWVRDHCQ